MFNKHPRALISELEQARKAVSFTSGNCGLQDVLWAARNALQQADEIFTLLPGLVKKLKRWPKNEEINAALGKSREDQRKELAAKREAAEEAARRTLQTTTD